MSAKKTSLVSMCQSPVFFWFRRDLRLEDNHALFKALHKNTDVRCVFIFDTNILKDLPRKDARVWFIHNQLEKLKKNMQEQNSDIFVYQGDPESIWTRLLKNTNSPKIYANEDYEPYARERDQKIKKRVEKKKGDFYAYKDQVLFHKEDILKEDRTPYTIFTPYSKKWKKALYQNPVLSYPSENYLKNLYKMPATFLPSLRDIGFQEKKFLIPSIKTPIQNYDKTRDYPGKVKGTSRLGIHFRFGTTSIRFWIEEAKKKNETFLNELCWRDFYQQILWHFPQVIREPFKAQYKNIEWRNGPEEFRLWCEGKTGYPMVDAGMRELNETGYMHNRARMVTASFLCKHLLIDWRWGERYFAEKLLDYDLAANNGGWQWAAGSGCDAAPYFRIFNPERQQKRFDSEERYIRKWVPEYKTDSYPSPMVEHKKARERAIKVYKEGLKKGT